MKSSPRLSGGDSKDSTASSDAGGLKFFQGLSPAMDFQINIPKLHSTNATNLFNQFHSFDNLSNTSSAITQTPSFNLDSSLMGFNFPLPSSNIHSHTNLASSIESLSSINQDLHWKLQQQRLATLFVEDSQKEASGSLEKTQSIQFHNLETPKADSCMIGTSRNKDNNFSTTEWFFSNSYAAVAPINPATSSGGDLNGNSGNNWSSSGTQAWNELTQFTSSLP